MQLQIDLFTGQRSADHLTIKMRLFLVDGDQKVAEDSHRLRKQEFIDRFDKIRYVFNAKKSEEGRIDVSDFGHDQGPSDKLRVVLEITPDVIDAPAPEALHGKLDCRKVQLAK